MSKFVLDAYKGWSSDQLKQRCRELVSVGISKDMLICQLVQFGSVDAMPKVFGDEVRRIVAAYCDDDDSDPDKR